MAKDYVRLPLDPAEQGCVTASAAPLWTPASHEGDDAKLVGGPFRLRSQNKRELVETWFFSVVRQFRADQGFPILMMLLPLYEKYLRSVHEMEEKENFSEGCAALTTVGKDLGISKREAYLFWQVFRHGILHHAMPRRSGDFPWVLRQSGPAVARHGSRYWINPAGMRDAVLPKIVANAEMWRDDDFPLADVYEIDER